MVAAGVAGLTVMVGDILRTAHCALRTAHQPPRPYCTAGARRWRSARIRARTIISTTGEPTGTPTITGREKTDEAEDLDYSAPAGCLACHDAAILRQTIAP